MDAPDSFEAGTFSIGELSKLCGVNTETIRYYERIKMLPAPSRTAVGRRVYSAADLRTLTFVRRSRDLQFPLDMIRELLRLGAPESAPCREVQRIALSHLENVRSKINTLARLESLLAQTTARCSTAGPARCWKFSMVGPLPGWRKRSNRIEAFKKSAATSGPSHQKRKRSSVV
jgi:MerR family mercuric resistance operon transcriptional regulator